MAMSPQEVASSLRHQKTSRSDTEQYVADFTARQRLVNEAVFSFAQMDLPEGATVIDACAGPEGSLLAASIRGYTWIGNDISGAFTRHLHATGAENIVMSDFSQSPFVHDSADGVFFVFALNNVVQHEDALTNTFRVLKEGGIAVVADPGPIMWMTNLTIHSLIESTGIGVDLLNKSVFTHDIPQFIQGKDFTLREYVDYFFYYSLGMNREDIYPYFYAMLDAAKKLKNVQFAMQSFLVVQYFNHVIQMGELAGLQTEKVGIINLGQSQSSQWVIDEPLQIPVDQWEQVYHQVRLSSGKAKEYMSEEVLHAQKRIVMPVVQFRK